MVRLRVLRFLERRGVIEEASGLTLLPDDLADRESALAQLATPSTLEKEPAGHESCRKIDALVGHGSTIPAIEGGS